MWFSYKSLSKGISSEDTPLEKMKTNNKNSVMDLKIGWSLSPDNKFTKSVKF